MPRPRGCPAGPRDNRLVHVTVPDDPTVRPRPGDLAETVITYAAPHHLNADDGLIDLRRTRGGDAWAARRAAPETRPTVTLGLPVDRRPDTASARSPAVEPG